MTRAQRQPPPSSLGRTTHNDPAQSTMALSLSRGTRGQPRSQWPLPLLGGEGRLPRSDHTLLRTGSTGVAPELAEQAYCRGVGFATPNMSLEGGLF